jgi:hypothetical protein
MPSDADQLGAVLASPVPAGAGRPTFILTWNPERWAWDVDEYARAVQVTAAGESWGEPWSAGPRTGGIFPGYRAFLLRQKRERA